MKSACAFSCASSGGDSDDPPVALSGELGVAGSLFSSVAGAMGSFGRLCSDGASFSCDAGLLAEFALLLLRGRRDKESRTCPKYELIICGNRLSVGSGFGVAAPGGVFAPEPM